MELRLLSTCPESDRTEPADYLHRVRRAARLAEKAGHGALVIHSDNRLLDPWVVAQEVLRATRHLRPVVTLQPLYMHPYAAAKKTLSLSRIFGRTPDLNLVAGGYRSDLLALDDRTGHDDRYRRLTEYAQVVRKLLASPTPIEHCGEFYNLHRPTGVGKLEPELMPRMLVAGTSAAGRAVAGLVGALAVRHPGASDDAPPIGDGDCVRIGIVARPTAEEAWEVAHTRFEPEPGRRLQHRLEMRFSDSDWQRSLSDAAVSDTPDSPYWLEPFDNRHAQCAFLVGDYRTLARELRTFMQAGVRDFLLDPPDGAAELRHTQEVFRRAWARFSSPLAVSA
jgi:alkanesulfonate monooxygenase